MHARLAVGVELDDGNAGTGESGGAPPLEIGAA